MDLNKETNDEIARLGVGIWEMFFLFLLATYCYIYATWFSSLAVVIVCCHIDSALSHCFKAIVENKSGTVRAAKRSKTRSTNTGGKEAV